jgi:xylobiose transport system permease protein
VKERPNYLAGVLTTIWLIVVAVPVYVMLKASLQSKSAYASDGPISWPTGLTVQNWMDVIQEGFLRYFGNTILVTVGTVILVIVLIAPLSYAIVRSRSRAVGWLFRMFLLGIAIPAQAVIVPIFYVVSQIGLYDNLISVVLVTAAFSLPVSMLVLSGTMRDITTDLYEAMALDGASPTRMFWQLVLPLSKSGLSTVAIFSAMNAWNGFVFPLILTQSSEKNVISLGLFDFQTDHGINVPGLMAAVLLSMLPMLLAYLFARRALMQGLMGVGGK